MNYRIQILIILFCFISCNSPKRLSTISIHIPEGDKETFYSPRSGRIDREGHGLILIDGQKKKMKYKSHGDSDSENTKRKSFNIRIINEYNKTLKRFNLLGMAEDDYYTNYLFAHKFLDFHKLSPYKMNYITLQINNSEKGKFMLLTEVPLKKIRERHKNALAIIRPLGPKKFNIVYQNKSINADEINSYIKELNSVNSFMQLNRLINFNEYSTLLSINSILMNGDYSDEIFFVLTRNPFSNTLYAQNFYGVDFEEIFSDSPNDNIYALNDKQRRSLIFSGLSHIDSFIAKDKQTYSKFLKIYQNILLEKFDFNILESISNEMINEIELINSEKTELFKSKEEIKKHFLENIFNLKKNITELKYKLWNEL